MKLDFAPRANLALGEPSGECCVDTKIDFGA
eukprot:SAG22_NODE_5786_length_952_cov_2.256741_1_plen_30_part_10